MDQPFELAVVGLNNVVEKLGLAMFALLRALTFLFQLSSGDWIAAVLIGVNDVRYLPVLTRLSQLRLSGSISTLFYRSQGVVQVLRDGLFSLCQAYTSVES